jgi:hypothetical protein
MIRVLCQLRSLMKRFSTLKAQGGFTIFHALVAGLIAGPCLAGAWIAYGNFTFQMRLMNADRQMDQYASSAMQHLTNYLSWSWGGEPIGGGTRGAIWRFQIKDNFNGLDPQRYHMRGDFVTLRYIPYGGILISDLQPTWAKDGLRQQYVWRGRPNQTGGGRQFAFDGRDGMMMTSMTIDYPAVSSNMWELKYATVLIEMKMQYRYKARDGISLFSNEYVHERTFRTTIFMRNWDVEKNEFKEGKRSTLG